MKRKMKTGHFEMVTMLLSAMILMDVFQVKANMLDMADNAFDDEYQKCTDRMEIKFVPQLLKEEKASHQLLEDVWENAKAKWEARKTQLFLPDGAGNNLILQSTNKTCSHYECAFLGGLKTANCIENMDYFQPIYISSPGDKNQKLEDPGMKSQESTVLPGMKSHEPIQIPGMKIPEPFPLPGIKVAQPDEKPAPAPAPGPGPVPKTHPSASSGKMLLPLFGTFIILISASAVSLHYFVV
ncbi:ecto-ADP-ribosyltransferase 3 isoform X5 [Molossus molossus]|uniref:ecto-ADP-ribosyltransferase 3 isoform X5 n=1 Tax=Molossus molossus TaxID=27622 RepID=UPI001745E563|nr:ecto-ADP-ribosyltransferase 3 isoform X5 [Molossus molossus]